MSEGAKSHKKLYFLVFLALAFLTIVELFIPGMDKSWGVKASLLGAMALVKAFLVAYYFMHLNMETWWMRAIALVPISAGFYALFVCLESMYR